MGQDYLLAIDNGTQSVRAILYDLQGRIVAKSKLPLTYDSFQPGWVEARPEYFWERVCEACQQLWTLAAVPKTAIAGVALTTQRGTVINLDRNGNPLRPAVVWPDKRRTDGLPPVGGLWGLLFGLIGLRETIAYFQAEAEANWIRTQEPEIWAKTAKYLLLSGYLTYRLTGQYADSVGCQVGYLPFDYKALNWAGKRDWKWQAVPMPREILPTLVPPGGTLGQISALAAEQTGIPAGLPLVAAAADKACEVLGAGGLASHIACLSFGTNATVNITYRKYVEAIPLIPPYPSAVPSAYSSETQIPRGYWMVNWFKTEFAEREVRLAAEQGAEPEVLFEKLLATTPPGADGLVLQPYWAPGLRIPGPEARGAVIGWHDTHTRAHLYRAMLEGLAYALREGKERCEKRSGVPVRELRIVGGGSQSDGALQITADIFGLPVVRPEHYEASALGAAMDAAVGLKLHASFDAAIQAMARAARTIEPNPRTRDVYEHTYHAIYKPLYGRLQPLYEALRPHGAL